jgi:hypothetical protein
MLAQFAGGLVEALPPRCPGWTELCQPQGDRASDPGGDRSTQSPSQAVGLGTPAKDATAPSTSLLLPHLRNLALSSHACPQSIRALASSSCAKETLLLCCVDCVFQVHLLFGKVPLSPRMLSFSGKYSEHLPFRPTRSTRREVWDKFVVVAHRDAAL